MRPATTIYPTRAAESSAPRRIGDIIAADPAITSTARRPRARRDSAPALRPERTHRATRPRAPYLTWPRLKLLAVVAERPNISTAGAAPFADLHRESARVALAKLQHAQLIEPTQSGRGGRRSWIVTPQGLAVLFGAVGRKCPQLLRDLPQTSTLIPSQLQALSAALDAAHSTARRLLRFGLTRHQTDAALALHPPDRILREVRRVEADPTARNRAALLAFRLLDPEADAKRRRALAARMPERLRGAFMGESRSMPARLYLHLAGAIRVLLRRNRRVTPGDVVGLAGSLRKDELARGFHRPPLD